MTRTQRARVVITEAHRKRYHELVVDKGLSLADATLTVRKEFDLTQPHTRQAVSRMFLMEGVRLGRGRRSATRGQPVQPSLDEMMEILVTSVEKAKDYDRVKAECEKYKRGYENAMALLAARENEDKKKKELAQRFKLAVQQGEIAAPLGS